MQRPTRAGTNTPPGGPGCDILPSSISPTTKVKNPQATSLGVLIFALSTKPLSSRLAPNRYERPRATPHMYRALEWVVLYNLA